MKSRLLSFGVLVGILLVCLVAFRLYLSAKFSATLEVSYTPTSATLTFDGKKQKTGVIRVTPGSHRVVVSKDGFSPEKTTISTTKGRRTYLGFVLQPSNPSTVDWYTKHPEDQRIAEKISGKNLEASAEKVLSLEPFTKELPFIGPGFSYRVGVGAADDTGKPTIVIHSVNDEATKDAKQWIRSMGYDPEKMNIIVNPNESSGD